MTSTSRLLTAMFIAGALSAAHAQTPPAKEPAAPAPQVAPGSTSAGGGMQDMQAVMKRMQEQMQKIQATTDPAERQKLMTEHTAAMREAMGTMMRMDNQPMQGRGMMRGRDRKSSSEPQGMPGRMGMMEQRMGMMQMLMEQMMQHQEMMERRQ